MTNEWVSLSENWDMSDRRGCDALVLDSVSLSVLRRSADESLPTSKRSQSKNEHLFSAAAGIKSSADRLTHRQFVASLRQRENSSTQ